MKIILPVFSLFLVWTTVLGQDKLAELERRNGFKDLKLGMSVDSVKGAVLKKEIKQNDEFPAQLYVVTHPEYEKIGEVTVRNVELKSYKGLVYEIRIVTDKDPRIMKALESLYGLATHDIKQGFYFWKTETLVLKFMPHGKKELEMTYTSYVILSMMKDDKGKKVQDIADDF